MQNTLKTHPLCYSMGRKSVIAKISNVFKGNISDGNIYIWYTRDHGNRK